MTAEKSKLKPYDVEEEVVKISFEEYERKYGIKQEPILDKYEEVEGLPVSRVSGFRWLTDKEEEQIEKYNPRRTSIFVILNCSIYRLMKRLHLVK